MKSKIGELNGRPLVISPYENEIKYPELLVTTEDNKIKDIKERNNGSMQSILSKSGSSDSQPDTGGGGDNNGYNTIMCFPSAVKYGDVAGTNTMVVVSSTVSNITIEGCAFIAIFNEEGRHPWGDGVPRAIFVNSIEGYEDLPECFDYPVAQLFCYPISLIYG